MKESLADAETPEGPARRIVPTATYRLQLHAGFGFRKAKELVGYLDALGISHVYASPYLSAAPGSTHGYDLVDPKRLNPELGSEDDYRAWTAALAARKMGHIVDIVPNHMAASTHNTWWSDVLENGPSSLYAGHFDIEWTPAKEALHGKVLLPVLGAQYGEVLEKGELQLERDGGAFVIRYWERRLPVNPSSLATLLGRAAGALDLPPDDPRRQELESIVTGLGHLPAATETTPDKRLERAREKEVLKRRLATVTEDGNVARAVDAEIASINGRPGDPKSFDELDRLLLDQCYRLAFWRVATEEINYRRFFDINDLAAVRMEEAAVFDDANELLLRLVAEGQIDGVRLDHTDGLYDPASFFEKMRAAMREARRRAPAGPAPGDPYLVAEKILGAGEELPRSWPIDGTTGYDFLVQASGVFVDPRAEPTMTRLHQVFTGDPRTFAEHARDAKRATMRSSLSSEIHMLSQKLERIAMRDRRSRDFTLPMLHRAVSETIAAFSVYRTYIRPDGTREAEDTPIVVRATRLARRRNPEVSPSVFDFLRDVLLLEHLPNDEDEQRARAEFAMRFQQLTGPVMAKSVEDTAFYTYVRFCALNEVGGDPSRFGTSPTEFHQANARRLEHWPFAMTASTTHDTKRSEDVRARLAVLSEMPESWETWLHEWSTIAERHVQKLEDEVAPSGVDQLLFFQTAIGAHPLEPLTNANADVFRDRLVAYAIKAAREAKQRTSWLSPDDGYEQALRGFVTAMMTDETFVASLGRRAGSIASHGASNGLAMRLLQLVSPGVPDTFQGSDLWDLRLVDPDNRGEVDYDQRRRALESALTAAPAELLRSFHDGRIKLRLLATALRLRRAEPRVFLEGTYEPIDAGDDALAFARRFGNRTIVAAVTRFPYRVTAGKRPWATGEVWGDQTIALPRGRWVDVLTNRTHEVSGDGSRDRTRAKDVFDVLPVALLSNIT